jgi:hypothetical protein
MDLFQAVSVAGEFFQLIMQLFLQGDVDLVSPLGDNGDGLVQIARLCLDIGEILGFHDIRGIGINLPS